MNALFFVLAWIMSGIGSILLAAVAVTYIRRTWQLIRAEEDDPTRERLLDGLDHLESQMHLVSRRLDSVEEKLGGIEGRLGPGGSEDRPDTTTSDRLHGEAEEEHAPVLPSGSSHEEAAP